jgi:hypothetical protein
VWMHASFHHCLQVRKLGSTRGFWYDEHVLTPASPSEAAGFVSAWISLRVAASSSLPALMDGRGLGPVFQEVVSASVLLKWWNRFCCGQKVYSVLLCRLYDVAWSGSAAWGTGPRSSSTCRCRWL